MPRLLLVDDNPSIHKIAETLLATSPIELVCADSAAAALDMVNRGERFDVALVDTSMAGMDGWGLLGRLREIPATARMPIAMMAGVLDTVDPQRIKEAPIQGFLKKPVELRELGDRIARLMETPVPLAEPPVPAPAASSPFATMPATRLDDLPEFRKQAAAAERIEPTVVAPVLDEPVAFAANEDDILELTEEDLYPEPVAPELGAPEPVAPELVAATPVEETLDLEELDLENLQGLSLPPQEPPAPLPTPVAAFPAMPEHAEPTPQEGSWPIEELDAIATLDRLPVPVAAVEPAPVPTIQSAEVELPDLGAPTEELLDISSLNNLPEIEELVTADQDAASEIPLASLLEAPEEGVAFTPPLPPLEESLDWSDESESMLAAVEAPAPARLPEEDLDLLEVSVPELSPEPGILQLDLEEVSPNLEEAEPAPEAVSETEVPSMPATSEEVVESALLESAATPVVEPEVVPVSLPAGSLGTKELLEAMLADPVMMDALAKAVVTRLGDQALREIAWEVIPELAERLPRTGA